MHSVLSRPGQSFMTRLLHEDSLVAVISNVFSIVCRSTRGTSQDKRVVLLSILFLYSDLSPCQNLVQMLLRMAYYHRSLDSLPCCNILLYRHYNEVKYFQDSILCGYFG